MIDWMAYVWVCVGVLLSAVLPYAVKVLWPGEPGIRLAGEPARDAFLRLWPGIRMLLASLAVGLAALAAARATNVDLSTWWQGVLVGLGADRLVQVAVSLARRK